VRALQRLEHTFIALLIERISQAHSAHASMLPKRKLARPAPQALSETQTTQAQSARTEMSSDEEDRYKRAQLHVKQRKLETGAGALELNDADHSSLFAMAEQRGIPPHECPKLCSIAQLTRDHAHLAQGTDCKLALGKSQPVQSAAQRDTSADSNAMLDVHLTKDQIIQRHAEQARVLPYKYVAFAEKMRELTPIRFYSDTASQSVTQQELEQQLLQGRLVLPHLSSDFERKLLAQAGTFKDKQTNQTRVYPECARGAKCIGMTVRIRHLPRPGVIFTSLMFPEEYQLFLETGATPQHARPCILCCREALVHWTIMCRADVMMGGPGASTPIKNMPWQMQQTQIRQLYYNSVDIAGGYQKDRVLLPSANEPLVHPIAMLSLTHISAKLVHGRYFIDQSAIEWHPPQDPEPHIGESHMDF
jgi:hypothetical protein